MLSSMLDRLTDNYKKDPGSNIGKLFSIVAGELEEIKGALNKTEDYRDIDQAIGEVLDRIGVNLQQPRGAATDEVYRILIKSSVARNLSTGDINTLIRILSVTLNTTAEGIAVQELYNDPAEPEAASVFISFPTELLNSIGFSINQFGRLVNLIVAAGVRAKVLFQGTFQFSSSNDALEIDADTGLADLEQTIGGTLGAVYSPGNDLDLPI